ncbi:MAG: FxsA family protein, partial [Alphaproteobacteria bacterium]
MIPFLFLLLLITPLIEIAVFIEVGGFIGLWPTLGIVLLTAMLGTALFRIQGIGILRQAQASLEANRFPAREVFDGLCLLVAGALLI